MRQLLRIDLYRTRYEPDRTIGRLYINGVFFGNTMEDIVRGRDIKVKNHTAISEGAYLVGITDSPKYGELMAEILNVPGFSGIRFHGGNHPKDTQGCILIARNEWRSFQKKVGMDVTTIQGSLKDKFNKFIRSVWKKEEKDIFIHIHNLTQ